MKHIASYEFPYYKFNTYYRIYRGKQYKKEKAGLSQHAKRMIRASKKLHKLLHEYFLSDKHKVEIECKNNARIYHIYIKK